MLQASRKLTSVSVRSGSRRFNSNQGSNANSGNGFTKAFLGGVALSASVVAGGLAYEYVDPEFRTTIEVQYPQLRTLNQFVLGDLPVPKPVKEVRFPSPSRGKPKAIAPTPSADASQKVEEAVTSHPASVPEVKKPRDSGSKSNSFAGPGNGEQKNKDLVESLREAIRSAESKTQDATRAKLDHMAAVEKHLAAIKAAVDGVELGNWDAVTVAHSNAQKAEKKGKEADADGRNYIDNLEKIIKDGQKGEETTKNPLLKNALESAKKMRSQLDELLNMSSTVDSELLFMKNYGHLIEQGRKRFAEELSAVLPNVDLKKLTESQLNTLLVHAHLKVDQLSRQLYEQKLNEEERIRQTLKLEKKKHLTELREKMEKEKMEQQKDILTVSETPKLQVDNKKGKMTEKDGHKVTDPSSTHKGSQVSEVEIALLRQQFDTELQKQLGENELMYTQKMEQVVRTQRQLFEIEKLDSVNTAVGVERQKTGSKITHALAKLEGIEKALKDRVVLDAENRRSKQAWLACQNLVDSIEYGKRGSCCMEGRRMPLNQQLKVLLKSSPEDVFVKTVESSVSPIAKQKGEYTRDDLKMRFEKVFSIGERIGSVSDSSPPTIGSYLSSYLQSLLSFKIPRDYTKEKKLDPIVESNADLLDRARWYIKQEDYVNAVRLLQQTKGPVKNVARDWIKDARSHEESLLLARLLLAHAACTSVKSTY